MKKETQTTEKDVLIGKRLRECRKNRGLTQQELAAIVYDLPENNEEERTPQQIGYIERGQRKLSLEWASLLAKALGVRMEYLLYKDDFETNWQKKIFPSVKSIAERSIRERALMSFFEVLGVSFEILVDEVDEAHKNITTDDFLNNATDEEIDKIFNSVFSKQSRYLLKSKHGDTIAVIDSSEKDHFFDEIYDFVEFKVNRLIERKELT